MMFIFQGWPSKYDDAWKLALTSENKCDSFDEVAIGLWGSLPWGSGARSSYEPLMNVELPTYNSTSAREVKIQST